MRRKSWPPVWAWQTPKAAAEPVMLKACVPVSAWVWAARQAWLPGAKARALPQALESGSGLKSVLARASALPWLAGSVAAKAASAG